MQWQNGKSTARIAGVLVLLLASAVITGCKLEISVPPGGHVVSESVSFSCGAGESCTIDITDVFFDETFRAVPNPGYTFVSWRQRPSSFCPDRNAPCRLTTTGFAGTPLMSILDQDDTFYLQPVFAKPNTWARLAYPPRDAVGAASCVIAGRLYIVGTGDHYTGTDEYDPVTNTWRARAALPTPQYLATASAVRGKCYVIGGGLFPDGEATTTVQAYDPVTDTWADKAPLPESRADAGSAVVDGKIYVVGGGDRAGDEGSQGRAAVAIYDPARNHWQTGAKMEVPRQGAAIAAFRNRILVAGGFTLQGAQDEYGKPRPGITGAVEVYIPASDYWFRITSLPSPLHRAGAVAHQGNIYVFGGLIDGSSVSNQVYRYSELNEFPWDSPTQLPTPRWGHTGAVIDRQIYLVGGGEAVPADAEVPPFPMHRYTPEPSTPTPARAFNCNGAPPEKATTVDAPAGGLYVGTLFDCAGGGSEQVFAWVGQDGRFRTFLPPTGWMRSWDPGELHLLAGSLQVDGDRIQGTGLQFAALGRPHFSGGATSLWMDGLVATGRSLDVDGSDLGVEGGQNLEGRWGTQWGDYGYFSLAKRSPQSPSNQQMADTWHGPSLGYSQNVTWVIDADLLIKGQDTAGCEYTGQLRLIDTHYFVYALDLTVTGCEVIGTYSGILHQQTGTGWGDFLSVSVDDGEQRSLSFFFLDSSWDRAE